MTDTLPFIRKFLESTKLDFEIMDCEPDLADTNIFCKKYVIKKVARDGIEPPTQAFSGPGSLDHATVPLLNLAF